MNNPTRLFLTCLFGLCSLLMVTSLAWGQYNYTITDPLRGNSIEEGVNLDFWEPWIGTPGNGGASETGYASISNEGLVLGSFSANLGARDGLPWKWVLTGDFRISLYLETSPDPGGYGNRLGVSVYESTPICGPLIYPDGYGSVWMGYSGPSADRHYPLQYGEAAFYLFVKSGNTLTIYKGDASGVTEDPANRVFHGDYFNPSGQFMFAAATGNPNAGWLRMRDVVIETEGLVACDGTMEIPPEWAGTNRSFWIIGAGEIQGKSIHVENMIYTTGGAFGQAFNPASITNVPWGSIDITFTSCDSGQLSWHTEVPGFENGGYDIIRLAADPFGDECVATGFDVINNPLWMSGLWYGGAPRDGEGFSVNIINGGRAVVTWYTYLPASSASIVMKARGLE